MPAPKDRFMLDPTPKELADRMSSRACLLIVFPAQYPATSITKATLSMDVLVTSVAAIIQLNAYRH